MRTTIAWLKEAHGIEDVGLIGGSMGGYIATLTAAVEPELKMLYALAPPIRMTDQMDQVPLGRYMVQGLEQQNVPENALGRLQELVDPAGMEPALATHRMRFIAGRNDLFVPAFHMERLERNWSGVQVHWHSWGHITLIVAWPPERLFEEIEAFAASLGF